MENTGQVATATVRTPGGRVTYAGDARIDGVPGTAAPVPIGFKDTAGSTCGSLLPTGGPVDVIQGVEVTCIDNGMPVVVLRAADLDCWATRPAKSWMPTWPSRPGSRRSAARPGRS